MSAAQIIEEIKALPPEEKAQVVEFVNEIRNQPQVQYMDEKTFAAAADAVFEKYPDLLKRLAE